MADDPTPVTDPSGKADPPKVDPPKVADKAEPTFKQADVDRIVADRLARERTKYADYDDLKAAATKSQPLQEQLDAVNKKLVEREKADTTRNGRLALEKVHTLLAENGIKREDVKGVLDRFDPVTLLADGDLDEKAITEFATSLSRVAGRATSDPDQGRKGGELEDMNSIIRRAAGR